MEGKISYTFSGRLWQHAGQSSWFFVSLPLDMAGEIRENLKWLQEGWGRLKATASIGLIQWDTAIWYDTKQQTYLLPVKGEIRKKEKLAADMEITVMLWV